jgi:hypothetical protein
MEDPREQQNAKKRKAEDNLAPEENLKQIKMDQEKLKEDYLKQNHTSYIIDLDEDTVEKELKNPTQLRFVVGNPGNDQLLSGIITKLQKLTVREFIALNQKSFVKFLKSILPVEKHTWSDSIEKVTPDEWLATVYRKILPEHSKPDGLKTLLSNVLNLTGVLISDLGKTEKEQKVNFEKIIEYLEAFCKTAEKFMPLLENSSSS